MSPPFLGAQGQSLHVPRSLLSGVSSGSQVLILPRTAKLPAGGQSVTLSGRFHCHLKHITGGGMGPRAGGGQVGPLL